MALMGMGIVLLILSPFTMLYDPSELNRWILVGVGTTLCVGGFLYEVIDMYQGWKRYRLTEKAEKEGADEA